MEEPDATQPLLPARENHQNAVRNNMSNIIRTLLYSSLIFIYLSILFSISKIVLGITAATLQFGQWNLGITIWVLLSTLIDAIWFIYNILRISVIQNIQRGDATEEPEWSTKTSRYLSIMYVSWIIPGNIWYWTEPCGESFMSAVALFFLICGYLYILIPCLFIALFCLWLPVMFIYILSIMRNAGAPTGATSEQLDTLEGKLWNANDYQGEEACSIWASEYTFDDKIVTLPCDTRHYFHETCIKDWLRLNASCPVCRTPLN